MKANANQGALSSSFITVVESKAKDLFLKAAGADAKLSKTEAKTLPPSLQAVAAEARNADSFARTVSRLAVANLNVFDEGSPADAVRYYSRKEIASLKKLAPELGQLAQEAYDLVRARPTNLGLPNSNLPND
jgi:hypothetical protein